MQPKLVVTTKLFHIYSCFKIHELGKAQQPTNDFLGAILKELGIVRDRMIFVSIKIENICHFLDDTTNIPRIFIICDMIRMCFY